MKTNLKDLDISDSDKELIKACGKTRNLATLSAVVKAAIARRDDLLGKEGTEFTFNFETKFSDAQSRARAEDLVDEILAMNDRKALSVLCATVIRQRKEIRGERG